MRNEFTAIVEQDGPWYIAYCPEVPGANGQGATHDKSLASLRDAIGLILQDRGRLARECAKLDPRVEQRLAEEGLAELTRNVAEADRPSEIDELPFK
jgi:predicted RNase H-like HicB family nuclease